MRPQDIVMVAASAKELSRLAAERWTQLAKQAVSESGSFNVALSGGKTPQSLYSLLSGEATPYRQEIPWAQCHFFWGDERPVPPNDPQSNFRMAQEALLSKVPVPQAHVHRIEAELEAPIAAGRYDGTLRKHFGLIPGEFPRFDLILLGVGPEGHTASLFPGSPALEESQRLVCANWVEKLGQSRITFTLPAINSAAHVLFLVSGSEKAAIAAQVIQGEKAQSFPAALVEPEGELLWLLDADAAALLKDN